MTTSPRMPPDEALLMGSMLERFLSSIGDGVVLVGGQALNFWMEWFNIDAEGMVVSTDGDLLGELVDAQALAAALAADIILPPKMARTSLVAQLRLRVDGGRVVNIDVLHKLYTVGGLKKSGEFTRRVAANSIRAKVGGDRVIRVMDPFDLLEARVQNAVGLFAEKGPHVVTQARWAIEVAGEALIALASNEGEASGRLGQRLQYLYAFARSSPGRRLWSERGLDVLNAVRLDELLAISPSHERQLQAIDLEQQRRRADQP
ncbi:MAG: hypothetical protein ABW220_01730 [Burkholderiaceae bacterium]